MIIVLLIIIALILWKIYRQRENEKTEARVKAYNEERILREKKLQQQYPHLIGNIDDTWLELFGERFVEKNLPHLKAMFLIYLKEANNTKLDMQVGHLFDCLWDLSEELMEHLEKYHETTKYEIDIALLTFWQIAAQQADSFVGKDFEAIKTMFKQPPFTDIENIAFWFPKKPNHPTNEISFTDEQGSFPRESKGSAIVKARVKALGI